MVCLQRCSLKHLFVGVDIPAVCATGYTGESCTTCAIGYFSAASPATQSDTCVQCPFYLNTTGPGATGANEPSACTGVLFGTVAETIHQGKTFWGLS
jgi:hypothetical protein